MIEESKVILGDSHVTKTDKDEYGVEDICGPVIVDDVDDIDYEDDSEF